MKTSKSSSSSTKATNSKRGTPRQRLWDGGIEITTSPTAVVDVRFLSVAIHFPYMFENPLGEMSIKRHWAAAFTLTCMEIDRFLGTNKRGFHWRQLDIEDGRPYWYWALDSRYDHSVTWSGSAVDSVVCIVPPAADPRNAIRSAIERFIEIGKQRTLTGDVVASNEGTMQ